MTASVETKKQATLHKLLDRLLTRFSPGQMPNIYNALVVQGTNEAGQELLT
jgi:hypothetical protein